MRSYGKSPISKRIVKDKIKSDRQEIWAKNHMEYYEKYRKMYYYKQKNDLAEILGGWICTKCNNRDKRCLQFDHINAGGIHDRTKFKGATVMWNYYINHPEEAKKKLQVLCANCNQIKKIEENEQPIQIQKRMGIDNPRTSSTHSPQYQEIRYHTTQNF